MRDTTPEVQERYYALLAERRPEERLAISLRLTRAVRDLAEVSIRSLHPEATDPQVRRLLTERLYGAKVAARLFNENERRGNDDG
jgi:hypothetical protein